jgi:hypothetical protein
LDELKADIEAVQTEIEVAVGPSREWRHFAHLETVARGLRTALVKMEIVAVAVAAHAAKDTAQAVATMTEEIAKVQEALDGAVGESCESGGLEPEAVVALYSKRADLHSRLAYLEAAAAEAHRAKRYKEGVEPPAWQMKVIFGPADRGVLGIKQKLPPPKKHRNGKPLKQVCLCNCCLPWFYRYFN